MRPYALLGPVILCRFWSVLVVLAILAVGPGRGEGQVISAPADTLGAVSVTPSSTDTSAIVRTILAAQDSLAAHSFRFGLSLGWRHLVALQADLQRSAAISPVDSTLSVDRIDRGDLVMSGVVVAFPFRQGRGTRKAEPRWYRDVGFIANVNLATFGAESLATFNTSIEGGLGVVLGLADDFALGATIERAFSRRLRNNAPVGKKVFVDGALLTSISSEDDRFFIDDNVTAISFKFIFFF